MEEGRVQYTTVTFAEENHHHPPPTRRNTTYTDIKHLPHTAIREASEKSEPSAAGEGDAERPPSPSYVSVGVCPPHTQLAEDSKRAGENAVYDVPPPPVPVRFGSQEGGAHDPSDPSKPSADTAASSNRIPDDPFLQNQFGDPFSGANAWNDPSAFYDKPRSILNSSSEVKEEDGYMEIGKVTTNASISDPSASSMMSNMADCTGDSSYEDTSSFLQDMRARYKNRPHDEVPMPGQHFPIREVDNEGDSGAYDVPPPAEVNSKMPDITLEEDAQLASYDFPSALKRYPRGEGAGEDLGGKKSEEPPLHTIQYPSAQRPPQQQQLGVSSSGSPATVTRSDSVARGRANVPLPPTPVEQSSLEGSGREELAPPPLPARQAGNVAGKASARDGPLPPLPQPNDRPRLPPMNHPWGNRRPPNQPLPPPPGHDDPYNPPLPPRKKAQGSTNGHEGAAAPQKEDPAMLDLMNKGYQRADIESALRIARNDFELARNILKEFGGRH